MGMDARRPQLLLAVRSPGPVAAAGAERDECLGVSADHPATPRGDNRDEEDHLHAVGRAFGLIKRTSQLRLRRSTGTGRGHLRDASMLTMEAPARRAFTSMGTTVELIAAPGSSERDVDRAWASIQRTFVREDRRFSRFKPDSELSKVNDAAGTWVRISKPFYELTRLALQAALDTEGLFDPTVLPALKAAGYDRDFSIVRTRGDQEDEELRQIRREFRDLMVRNSTACGAWQQIRLAEDRIRLPEGAELDFGGIAKGWTVDMAAAEASRFDWAILDAGGDLRIFGEPPEGGLQVAVEDPEERASEALRVGISSGALATTSVKVRSWG